MTLAAFVSQGWSEHAADPAAIFARLPSAVSLVAGDADLPPLAGLIVHVAGEHLGRWGEGIALLDALVARPGFDAAAPGARAVLRSRAVLFRCAGDFAAEAEAFAASSAGGDVDGDRIGVLAVAAAALLGQGRVADASRDFDAAAGLWAAGRPATDPTARALAVTANNLAVTLENAPELTADARALMLRAAAVARVTWGLAGGWREHERAEYRLAMSHLRAGDAAAALRHAEACRRIVEENGSDPGEAFFAHEALARARRAGGDADAARIERAEMARLLPTIPDDGFRAYAAGVLDGLDA